MLEYAGSQRSGLRARRTTDVEGLVGVLRRVDWILFGAVAAVVGVGLWAVSGITAHDVDGASTYFVFRQGMYAVVGGVGLVAATFVDPDLYRRYWRGIFIGICALIAIVYVAGPVTRGSKRWLDLGFFTFQPSEFGKLLFVLALAGFLAERGRRIRETDTTLRAASARFRSRSSSSSPTSGRRSSTRPRSPPCSSSRGRAGRTSRRSPRSSSPPPCSCSSCCRTRGSTC